VGYLGIAAVMMLGSAVSGDQPEKFPGSVAPKKLGTVRTTIAALKESGGDTSILDCYACHDEDTPPTLQRDAAGLVVLPKEHADLIIAMRDCSTCHWNEKLELEYDADFNPIVPDAHKALLQIAHGKNNRNNDCFNCHDPMKLNSLVTRDGTHLTFDQSNQLCAGCHGPIYNDWENGVHGRTTGYWNRDLGDIRREECVACHDPHAPAFPQLIPMPGPRAMRPGDGEAESRESEPVLP